MAQRYGRDTAGRMINYGIKQWGRNGTTTRTDHLKESEKQD